MLRYVLLALLSDGDPKHGYALMKAYADRSGTRLSIGNVYRELQRLVADGLITAATNPAGADPRRMPYAITKSGLEAFRTWLAAPAHALVRTTPDLISYRLALLGDLEAAVAGRFLKELQEELWVQTKALERERTVVTQHERVAEGTLSMRSILLGRRTRHLAADIAMVDEIRTTLQAAQKRGDARVPRLAIESPAARRPRPKQERRAYEDEV
jgi:DNA-binding PadR family transcriptional regulator